MSDTITLYRPVGPKELKLLEESGFRRWPPRLPEQPIFYPVTNEPYAIEIASRWNVKGDGVGYVTRFAVRADFMQRYEVQKVGAQHHTEWWVHGYEPAPHVGSVEKFLAIVDEDKHACFFG